MKNISIKIVLSLLLFLFLPSMVYANGNGGTILVSFSYGTEVETMQGIETSLYYVADINKDTGSYLLTDDYREDEATGSLDEIQIAAKNKEMSEKILEKVKREGLKPDAQVLSDAEGTVEFQNVREGLYLLVSQGDEKHEILPVLLSMPQQLVHAAESYEFNVHVKVGTPQTLERPISPGMDQVRTGDSLEIEFWIGLLLLSLGLTSCIILKKVKIIENK